MSIHVLKRQVTLIKRLLWRTLDVVQRMTPASGRAASLFRDVQENVESYHFYADELLDDANTILNLQLALAAHRTGRGHADPDRLFRVLPAAHVPRRASTA